MVANPPSKIKKERIAALVRDTEHQIAELDHAYRNMQTRMQRLALVNRRAELVRKLSALARQQKAAANEAGWVTRYTEGSRSSDTVTSAGLVSLALQRVGLL